MANNWELNRELKTAFGSVSSLYEKARTSYPQALIDEIITYSKLQKGSKILDIGCGSGQATLLFAQQGFNVTGLDINSELLSIAKEKCVDNSSVTFELGSFEEIAFPSHSFDAIVCGMAWHWLTPATRYEKAFEVLKKQGTLALFWSYQQKEKSQFVQEIGVILEKFGGANAGPTGHRVKIIAEQDYNRLINHPQFTSVEKKEFYEIVDFTKERYIDLVLTYAWAQKLSDEQKENLVRDLQEACVKYEQHLNIPYCYVLILAKTR